MKATDFIMAAGSILAGIKTLADGFGEIAEATGKVSFKPDKAGPEAVATSHHVGRDIKERIHHIKDMTQKGMRSPVVRAFAIRVLSSRCARCEGCKKINVVTDIAKHINPRPGMVRGVVQGNEWVCGACSAVNAIGKTTWCVPEKNWRSELEAIFEAVRSHIRYTRDIEGIDTYQHPARTLEWGGGDCFPKGTKFLARGYLVPVEDVKVGDEIHDGERWVDVLKTWDRGPKRILRFRLNNVSILRLSDTHKVLRVPRIKSGNLPGSYDSAEEIQASELKVGDDLLQPRGFKATKSLSNYKIVRSGEQPWAKVVSIEEEEELVQSYDVMTTSGRVYLPEADVITRQCDDYTIVLASMLKSVGYPVKARTMEQRNPQTGQRFGTWGHILLIAGVPPQKPTGWLPLDASVDKPAGWYPPKQMIYRTQDFDL